MEFMKQAFGEFHKFLCEMTTNVRNCLSNDFKTVFIGRRSWTVLSSGNITLLRFDDDVTRL